MGKLKGAKDALKGDEDIKRPGRGAQWQWGNNGEEFNGDGDALKGDDEALRVTERR